MKNFRAGFTMVELIVVIAILATLAGIAIPRFINSTEVARGSKILADMNACESAVNIYYAKNGTFPEGAETLAAAYLAEWPKPPAGTALVKKYDNNDLTLRVQALRYIYVKPAEGSELNISAGRVTLGGMTIEDFLASSESSLTLTD